MSSKMVVVVVGPSLNVVHLHVIQLDSADLPDNIAQNVMGKVAMHHSSNCCTKVFNSTCPRILKHDSSMGHSCYCFLRVSWTLESSS